MGQRPYLEHIAMHLRVPRGQEGIWQIIKDLAAAQPTFTLAEIDRRMKIHVATINDYVKRLVRSGYIEIDHVEEAQRGPGRQHYRLIRTARDAPRLRRDGIELPETAQETLWRTMKMLKRFTARALVAAAETETRLIPLGTTHRYMCQLAEVGVLSRIPNAQKVDIEYLLVRNLGGAAPKILRTHIVYDPNSNTVLGAPEAKEVA